MRCLRLGEQQILWLGYNILIRHHTLVISKNMEFFMRRYIRNSMNFSIVLRFDMLMVLVGDVGVSGNGLAGGGAGVDLTIFSGFVLVVVQ